MIHQWWSSWFQTCRNQNFKFQNQKNNLLIALHPKPWIKKLDIHDAHHDSENDNHHWCLLINWLIACLNKICWSFGFVQLSLMNHQSREIEMWKIKFKILVSNFLVHGLGCRTINNLFFDFEIWNFDFMFWIMMIIIDES